MISFLSRIDPQHILYLLLGKRLISPKNKKKKESHMNAMISRDILNIHSV